MKYLTQFLALNNYVIYVSYYRCIIINQFITSII